MKLSWNPSNNRSSPALSLDDGANHRADRPPWPAGPGRGTGSPTQPPAGYSPRVSRTQLVTEKLLDTLVMTEAEHAVIDITGIPTVETEVAQHLGQDGEAARLMGAECMVTWIRPHIAHTVVSQGIEFVDQIAVRRA